MPGCAGTTRGEAASGRRSCSRACCHCCAEESVDILDESVGVPTRHRSCWSESSIGDSRLVVRSSRKEASVYFGNGFMLQICSKFATNRDAVYIYIYIYRERERVFAFVSANAQRMGFMFQHLMHWWQKTSHIRGDTSIVHRATPRPAAPRQSVRPPRPVRPPAWPAQRASASPRPGR